MPLRIAALVLVAAVLGGVGYAVVRSETSPPNVPLSVARDPAGMQTPLNPRQGMALPPNHPPIGTHATESHGAGPIPQSDEAAAITWKVPEAWSTVGNASSMRIATYRGVQATGDTEPPEMSVTRAGGSTDANIQRWIGQFDDAGKETRDEKTIAGLRVTVVQVLGTFRGGGAMMPGSAGTPRKNWALLGAIVETSGAPYFFKMTGPAASVKASRAAFDALLLSIRAL